MEKELTVLLVEDDPTSCKKIISLFDNSDDMILIGVTNSAFKAIEYIQNSLPDVVILDLELHIGCGSGLDVLQGLKTLELGRNPYILITTNNLSSITYESARQLGADYIMSKHQENYSEGAVIDLLRILSPVIKNRPPSATDNNAVENSPEYYEKRVRRRVMTELNNIGIKQKAVGYMYLVDAIMLTIKQPTQNLSNIIAQNYNKTESSVERAMQNAINRTWATSDINDLLTHYTAKISSTKGVPTLTEFIYFYANKIKNEY